MWGKIVSLVLCATVVLATAVPLTASAEPVRWDIASDPAKVIAEIEAMNLPDMPDELAAELRGEGYYVLYGYLLQLASWCTMYCQAVYDSIDAYLTTFDLYYASLPKGTPVYTGTAQSTPAYYK